MAPEEQKQAYAPVFITMRDFKLIKKSLFPK